MTNNVIEEFGLLEKRILELQSKRFDFKCDVKPEISFDAYKGESGVAFQTLKKAQNSLKEVLSECDEDIRQSIEEAITECINYFEECIDDVQTWAFEEHEAIVELAEEYRDDYDDDEEKYEMFSELINDGFSEEHDTIENEFISELTEILSDFKDLYVEFKVDIDELLAKYEFTHTEEGYSYSSEPVVKELIQRYINNFNEMMFEKDSVQDKLITRCGNWIETLVYYYRLDLSMLMPYKQGEQYKEELKKARKASKGTQEGGLLRYFAGIGTMISADTNEEDCEE